MTVLTRDTPYIRRFEGVRPAWITSIQRYDEFSIPLTPRQPRWHPDRAPSVAFASRSLPVRDAYEQRSERDTNGTQSGNNRICRCQSSSESFPDWATIIPIEPRACHANTVRFRTTLGFHPAMPRTAILHDSFEQFKTIGTLTVPRRSSTTSQRWSRSRKVCARIKHVSPGLWQSCTIALWNGNVWPRH